MFRIYGSWSLCAMWAVLLPSGLSGQESTKTVKYKVTPDPEVTTNLLSRHGGKLYLGELDNNGNFWPMTPILGAHRDETIKALYNLPRIKYLINWNVKGPVYEYRSGRLIKGRLDGVRFIPDAGSQVISLQDYKENLPIYNLPGRLVKVKDSGSKER